MNWKARLLDGLKWAKNNLVETFQKLGAGDEVAHEIDALTDELEPIIEKFLEKRGLPTALSHVIVHSVMVSIDSAAAGLLQAKA